MGYSKEIFFWNWVFMYSMVCKNLVVAIMRYNQIKISSFPEKIFRFAEKIFRENDYVQVIPRKCEQSRL